MIQIRKPNVEDREPLLELMRIAFNPPGAWWRNVAPRMDASELDEFLCAYEGGRLAAMTRSHDLRQWFGGRPVRMAGIAAVASVPELRGGGIASDLMRELLRKTRGEGALISTLYPSRASVYRRLGYEYAGLRTQYRVPLAELPAQTAAGEETAAGAARKLILEEIGEADASRVTQCLRALAAGQNGLIELDGEKWWRDRLLRTWADQTWRAVLVRGAGTIDGSRAAGTPGRDDSAGVEGYAAFQLNPGEGLGFGISCTHLVWLTPEALASLLGYFRGFRGIGQNLTWWGPPNDPMGVVAQAGMDSITPVRTLRFMTRLLDVEGALVARGYPPVSGELVISVDDEIFPENRGPFRITADGGAVRVSRVERAERRAIPIGALSSMYTGHFSPSDLVRLGHLDPGDPSIGLLTGLFTGAPPWMPDMF